MIMVGRSLVCGSRGGAPSPVPGPRAGGLPERRHERAGAARRARGGRGVAARAGRSTGAAASRGSSTRSSASPSCARAWPALFGATAADVAVTGSTTDGINAVLHAVDIQPGDEILTSDEEHPGVLGPLATARDSRGARVRVVPVRRAAGRGRPGHALRGVLARLLGHRPRDGHRAADGLGRDRRAGRRAGPRRRADRRARASAATSTPPRARSGSAAPAAWATSTPNPELVPSLPAPWAGYHSLEDRRARARPGAVAGRAPARHRLPRAAPRGVGARLSRRARGAGLRPRPRARRRAGGPARGAARASGA